MELCLVFLPINILIDCTIICYGENTAYQENSIPNNQYNWTTPKRKMRHGISLNNYMVETLAAEKNQQSVDWTIATIDN